MYVEGRAISAKRLIAGLPVPDNWPFQGGVFAVVHHLSTFLFCCFAGDSLVVIYLGKCCSLRLLQVGQVIRKLV